MRSIFLMLVVVVGCGGDAGERPEVEVSDGVDTVEAEAVNEVAEVSDEVAEVEVEEEVVARPGSFRWDLAAVGEADFYAYPWPSALRTKENGAADLGAFSTSRALTSILADAVHAVEIGPPGFSPLTSAYFGLTVELDAATLEGQVWLVDLDRMERLAATVEWNGPGGGYWPAKTLAVHPDYQQPPRAGARLAAVLLRGLKTVAGDALEAPDTLDVERDAVMATMAKLGVDAGEVLAWTAWTAADPMADLRRLADWVRRQPAPTVSGWRLVAANEAFDRYAGELEIVEAMAGEPPFASPFGAGLIEVGADGTPVTQRRVVIPFTLSVPTGEMPTEGYPIVLYGHGLGEPNDGFIRTAAAALGSRGVAVIGLDPPMQGMRNTTGIDDRTLIVQLSVGNIVGGREILRQGVLDGLQLARLVGDASFVVPAEVAADGAALRFDGGRIGFFGHSEGAQIGALLLPLEPAIGPAVFSEGGGGAAITMLVLKLEELDVGAAVAQFLGIDASVERWQLGHPVVSTVIQPLLDAADPLHCARHIVREPLPGSVGHDLVMLEGFLDALTPPVSIEALASAIGLPIAEPVARAIAGLDAQSIGSVALPASGNLPEVGGFTPTGALLQLPEEDHYIIYFNAAVRQQLMSFLASALAGEATLGPAQ